MLKVLTKVGKQSCLKGYSFSYIQNKQILRNVYSTQYRMASILSNLKPAKGATKSATIVGRGPSSGKGRSAGRGRGGQKSRESVHPWFEGGQTRIIERFPKFGRKPSIRTIKDYKTIYLKKLQHWIHKGRLDPSKPITLKDMYDSGLFNISNIRTGKNNGVKLLAGDLSYFNYKIQIEASAASKAAIDIIERSGGTYVSKYFSPLALRYHLNPQQFKRPIRSPLPVLKQDVIRYSSEKNRGYLRGLNLAPLLPRIPRTFGSSGSLSKSKTIKVPVLSNEVTPQLLAFKKNIPINSKDESFKKLLKLKAVPVRAILNADKSSSSKKTKSK